MTRTTLAPPGRPRPPAPGTTDRGAHHVWGVTVAGDRRRWIRVIARRLRGAVTAGLVTVTILLGSAGTLMASTSSAHADILGVSDTVQDWICGIVSPNEPWEAVGEARKAGCPTATSPARNRSRSRHADPTTGLMFTTVAQATDVVPDTMDQLPALPAGDYTLYEIAGLRGLSWWTIPLSTDGTRDCSLWNYVWSQTGNLIFTINKTLLQVTIAIKEAAASDDPLKFLYDESSGAISTVFAVFFVPIATLMFILAGLWAGVNALRKSGIRAALGAAAIAACIIALAGFLYSVVNNNGTNGFRSVAGTVDQAINEVNAVASNALFDGLAQESGACTSRPDRPARSAGNGSPPACSPTPWPTGPGRSDSSAGQAPTPSRCPLLGPSCNRAPVAWCPSTNSATKKRCPATSRSAAARTCAPI